MSGKTATSSSTSWRKPGAMRWSACGALTPPNCGDILDNLHDGLYVVDPERRITYWNRAAERISGFRAAEVKGSSCSENLLVHVDEQGQSLCRNLCPIAATLRDGQPRDAEVYLHHKDGHRVPVSIRVAPIRDAEGHITGATELFSDNGAVRHLREQIAGLRRLALLDPLTNLPNRRFLEAQIDAHLALLGRQSIPFGFLFADIDHFKRFNDTYGHEVGDAALRTVAATLRGCMRPFDSIGRWGGEEFAGILANCDVPESQRIAERLCALVRQSRIRVAHRTDLAVTVSIGVTRGKPGDSGQSLVARGDALMYRSKELGRDRVTADAD